MDLSVFVFLFFFLYDVRQLTTQWRNDITRYFQHGVGERIPVMMLGLKRDARVEEEGVIYPQEVRSLDSVLYLVVIGN